MEREPNDNSNERMADRPRPDEERLDQSPLSVDDTASEESTLPPIDDV